MSGSRDFNRKVTKERLESEKVTESRDFNNRDSNSKVTKKSRGFNRKVPRQKIEILIGKVEINREVLRK